MDKLIPVIEFLKKNKFWLTSGLIAVTMIGAWFYGKGQVEKQTKDWTSKIKNSANSAGNILKVQPEGVELNAHPNDGTIEGMNAELEEGIDSVVKAWESRYAAQTKEIAVWPKEVIKSEEFLELFSQYDPPETFPEENKGENMMGFLKIYSQQIPAQMDNIVKFAKTSWKYSTKKSSSEDGRPSVAGMARESGEVNKDEIVVWDAENQDLWHTKLTSFRGRDDNQLSANVPTPLQVFMLQQDLWLLEAMFKVIRDVNRVDGADPAANDLATIKRIDHVAFGLEAVGVLGTVEAPVPFGAAATGTKKKSSLMSDTEFQRSKRGRRARKDPTAFDPGADPSPFHGRYVNENFEPIAAKDVRAVITGTDLPENNLELVVAKRVPFRLGVIMDERNIAQFKKQCTQSEFAFEIQQTRINRHTPGEGIKLRSGGTKKKSNRNAPKRGDNLSMGGGGQASTGSMERDGGNKKGGGGGSGSMETGEIGAVESRSNFDVKVEFYGIVKIYNKVDADRLRGKKKTAGAAANAGDTTKP